ncbi:MAG: hypothetical protein WDM71_10010 [Ferruginibacter sp.]
MGKSGQLELWDTTDSNTDVIINSGTAVINSAVIIRSLQLNTSATHLTVNTNYSLKVLH